jgi:hypothetical protein
MLNPAHFKDYFISYQESSEREMDMTFMDHNLFLAQKFMMHRDFSLQGKMEEIKDDISYKFSF